MSVWSTGGATASSGCWTFLVDGRASFQPLQFQADAARYDFSDWATTHRVPCQWFIGNFLKNLEPSRRVCGIFGNRLVDIGRHLVLPMNERCWTHIYPSLQSVSSPL